MPDVPVLLVTLRSPVVLVLGGQLRSVPVFVAVPISWADYDGRTRLSTDAVMFRVQRVFPKPEKPGPMQVSSGPKMVIDLEVPLSNIAGAVPWAQERSN